MSRARRRSPGWPSPQRGGETQRESLRLAPGPVLGLGARERRLAVFGYERNSLVERRGEFPGRGGIVDISPPAGEPVRADFFGDEITSLRTFSVSSQRSRGEAGEVEILPVRELLLGPETMERARRLLGAEEAAGGRPLGIAAGDAPR